MPSSLNKIQGFFALLSRFARPKSLVNCALFISLVLLSLWFFFSSDYTIRIKNLKRHVYYLSSNQLEGRQTGTQGERLATQYVAQFFHSLSLEPAGDNGTYFQSFAFTSGFSVDKASTLALGESPKHILPLSLGREWYPLSYSKDQQINESIELVFAGYGFKGPSTSKKSSYNSYAGLNVKGKWVVVTQGLPPQDAENNNNRWLPLELLRYKMYLAKAQGARGILFLVSNQTQQLGIGEIATMLNGRMPQTNIVALAIEKDVLRKVLKTTDKKATPVPALQPGLINIEQARMMKLAQITLNASLKFTEVKQSGRNVIAKLRLNPNAKKTLVVGAHIDHLGYGDNPASRAIAQQKGKLHPGADDNASGVASVMEAAAKIVSLHKNKKLTANKNILFVAWSGEELGILGSTFFVEHYLKPNSTTTNKLANPIDAVINLDMIGHLNNALVIQGVGSSHQWNDVIKKASQQRTLTIKVQQDPYLPTDSTAFYLHSIPGLNLFTGAHNEYHSPNDTPDTLNYKGIKKSTDFLVNLIITILKHPQPIAFHQVPSPKTQTSSRSKIYLGTIPSYTNETTNGVKIAGVTKNSPADRSGLLSNDIIIQLAGHSINDIYEYTYAIDNLPVGRPVELVVIRNHTQRQLTIVAKLRSE